jgi:hypothetical protein
VSLVYSGVWLVYLSRSKRVARRRPSDDAGRVRL